MQRLLRAKKDFRSTTLRNQLTSLILYETILTGRGNGRRLVSFADRFFNKIKLADLGAKKLAHKVLLDKNAVKKTFEEILPLFETNITNYTRFLNVAARRGDGARRVAVMFSSVAPAMSAKVTAKPPKAKKPVVKIKRNTNAVKK